jgi:hypothetical protein
LKVTAFWAAVALNPEPKMVTVVPAGPEPGLNARIATAELPRPIDKILPAASYVYVAVLPAASAMPTSRPAASYAKTKGPMEEESAVTADAPVVLPEAPLKGEARVAVGAALCCATSMLEGPSMNNAIATRQMPEELNNR